MLNAVLRSQPSAYLGSGPFAMLLNHPKLLDFDVKSSHFTLELRRLDKHFHLGV